MLPGKWGGEFFVGLSGDFSFYKVDTEKLDITGASVSNVSGEIKNKEYQLGGYAGMRMDINDNDADDEAGAVVGADVELFKNFTLNVEGRFAAGNALSFGGTYKF